ncbi:MAG: flagellar type III secretion system pore protein FliP [Angelakisella sp.]|nr:flagellar type III secretion system pore protein FliP [Angelakisella sp.]
MQDKKDTKKALKKQSYIFCASLLITVLLVGLLSTTAYAAPSVIVDFASGDTSEGAFGALELLFLLLLLALGPSILIMMTSFTRIVIVLSFLRNALGTQQSPPNQIIIGLALFLSLFIMNPVIEQINTQAYEPYKKGIITQEEFMDNAIEPLKVFMLKQIQDKDLQLFLSMSGSEDQVVIEGVDSPEKLTALGLEVIVPAFITSELKRAFTIGFLLFIPFLIIDMVVASTLMSMGMVMLPPSMIALPFKLMMFILVDGWGLLLGTLAKSFR